MDNVCPLCGGSGKTIVKTQHGQTGMAKTAVQWCLCTKSHLVSESSNFRLLASLGGSYPDRISSSLQFIPENLRESPNLLIFGDFDTFRLQVKGVVMNYRFRDPPLSLYCCQAIALLQKFYVEQEEGYRLSDVEKFDLLVFALGTKEKNSQLNTVISQVVYSRLKNKRPTWIYLPSNKLAECIQEYSQDLEEYLKEYKHIRIDSSGGVIQDKSISKNEASNFSL